MKVSWDYNFQIFPIYGKIKHVPLTLKIIWVKDRVSKIAERHEKPETHLEQSLQMGIQKLGSQTRARSTWMTSPQYDRC